MTAIEAQQMLLQFRVADWPNMKDADRKRMHKSIEQMAYPVQKSSKANKLSNADLAKLLMRR